MRTAFRCPHGYHGAACGGLVLGLAAALAAPGCGHKAENEVPSAAEPPTVQIVHPEYRKIVRTVGQPSFVEAYERTSIYPKVTGFIEQWNVDIGDKVKKGDVLARLFVPELVEDCETKHRTVRLDQKKVKLAEAVVEVARADVEAAVAALKEAKAIVEKYRSDTRRWESEVARLEKEVERTVVAPQILLESQNQYRMSKASWVAADAGVEKAKAKLLSAKQTLAEDEVNVEVARARVGVSDSDAKRMDAWVGYLDLIAPFDGVITGRNANTWDFVLPQTGDPTADTRSPYLSPGNKAAPIYVVDRTDIVRVFVDIPEADADYVQIGAKASVQIKGYSDQWIPATVTRTSWALNVKSRTLRAEIDLPNPKRKDKREPQFRPGMYAYGKVIIERKDVRALPEAALVHSGDETYYWSYEDGKTVRTQVETGVSDGVWTEVTNRKPTGPSNGDERVEITGKEEVIVGDLLLLSEGGAVKVAGAPGENGESK
jgi:multidrug efflux pump subunit AcrA (membrane-fusion protein)